MRSLVLFLVLFFFIASSTGQSVGAISASLCNATSAQIDQWAYFSNPGALAYLKENQVGLNYQDRFLLRELQTQAGVGAIRYKNGVFSFGALLYGYEVNRTSRIGLGYSMLLSEKLAFGLQGNYHQLRLAQNYGSARMLTVETGLVYKINPSFQLGMSVYNLGRSKLSLFPMERLTTRMRIGGSAKISSSLRVNFDFQKQLEYAPEFRCGLEYMPMKYLFFRGGIAIGVPELAFGIGYKWKQIQMDLASLHQQNLGWSPVLTFSYLGRSKGD
jgi:hypothetical protein